MQDSGSFLVTFEYIIYVIQFDFFSVDSFMSILAPSIYFNLVLLILIISEEFLVVSLIKIPNLHCHQAPR